MQRREVLAATAALLGLAGCVEGSMPDETDTGTPTTTTTEETPSAPTYVGADLAMTNAACAAEDATRASVSFGESAVTVDGTIVGADACHVAALDAVVHDEQENELTVVVQTSREAGPDTGCAQCITAIDYTVTARFAGGLPERVVVSHRRDGELRQVTAVTRS